MSNPIITGITVSVIISAIIIIIWYLNQPPIDKLLKEEILKSKLEDYGYHIRKITKDDIQEFPVIVQRYLEYSGVLKKELPHNLTMSLSGLFRTNLKQSWFKAKTIQFNILTNPTRIFIIRLRLFSIFSMTGKDIYFKGKGYMIGTFMRLKKLFDESGEEFNIGEFTTFLNDIILVCPAGLITIKENLEWTEIDETTVEVKLSNQTQSVKAKLYFEPSGKLINFTSNDRFFDEKNENGKVSYVRRQWSTPVDGYKRINGLNLPSQVRAIWHLESGEFCYANFTLNSIKYNTSLNSISK